LKVGTISPRTEGRILIVKDLGIKATVDGTTITLGL
jgi:hypothetical protein